MTLAKDYPFAEIALAIKKLADKGALCFLKFTCEGCGKRLTSGEPNTVFDKGYCEECGHVTDITKRGGNYTLVMQDTVARNFIEGKWQPADECPFRHKHKTGISK